MRPIIPKDRLNPDEENRVDTILRIIRDSLPLDTKLRVLDVGCGDGRISMELALDGHAVYGIDIDDDQLQDAFDYRKQIDGKYPIYYKMDALDLEFANDSFDLVICSEMLEHLPKEDMVKKVVKELKRVCQPEGRIIVTTPWNDTIKGSERMPHFRKFDHPDLKELFGKGTLFDIPLKEDPKRGWIGYIARGRPRISVIIPSYNNGRFIGDAIESVLNQKDFFDYEIIVVEDGSTDDSVSVISKYPDVRLIMHPRNMGVGQAWRTGFENATGDYCMILSADDMLTDTCLRTTYDAMKDSDVNLMCYGQVISLFQKDGSKQGPGSLPNPDYNRLIEENYIGFAVLINSRLKDEKTSLGETVLDAYPDEYGACDWGLWLKIFDYQARHGGNILNLKHPLYIYRIHPKQETFNPERKKTMPKNVELVQQRARERRERK